MQSLVRQAFFSVDTNFYPSTPVDQAEPEPRNPAVHGREGFGFVYDVVRVHRAR